MDKIITIIVIIVAIDLIYHHVRGEQKGCDGACRDCSIRRVCDKPEKISIFLAVVMLLAGGGVNISHHCRHCHHHNELLCMHTCEHEEHESAEGCLPNCGCWFQHVDIDNYQFVESTSAPAPQQLHTLFPANLSPQNLLSYISAEEKHSLLTTGPPPIDHLGRLTLQNIHKWTI